MIFPEPAYEMGESIISLRDFNNNSYYATVPVIDLNDNYAIAGKLDVLSGRCTAETLSNTSYCQTFLDEYNITNMTMQQNLSIDFTGDLTIITQNNVATLSKSLMYAVVAPIFSLIITIVFVKELANILGSEIGLKTFVSI